MAQEQPGVIGVIMFLAILYFNIASITWLCRNQTANCMTTWTRFPHVVRFEKLAEYQVIETHESIGPR